MYQPDFRPSLLNQSNVIATVSIVGCSYRESLYEIVHLHHEATRYWGPASQVRVLQRPYADASIGFAPTQDVCFEV